MAQKRLRGGVPADRLSELPDLLLLRILSSMKMKDAVKTGTLSKRWQNLWTRVDNIVYRFDNEKSRLPTESCYHWVERNQEKLTSFINATLTQHQSNIKLFLLQSFYLLKKDTYALMDDWIRRVLEKKVEVLKLYGDGRCSAPDCLFQISSLTELELKDFLVPEELPVAVKWNLLKSLCLDSIWLSDESMEQILLGSPVLESLVLRGVADLESINITSPSVLKLKLYDFRCVDGVPACDGNLILKIRAPWLQELEILGAFLVAKCQIEDLSSLVKATLTCTAYDTSKWINEEDDEWKDEREFNAKWIDMAPHVLRDISHVAELSIGTELIQVLSLAKLYAKPSPSFQCKHLTINSPLWNYDVLGISCLLENTPHLETLVINVSPAQFECPFNETILFDYEDMDLSLPKGNFVHLKNVKIDYNRNPCADNPAHVGGYCNDVEIVGHIMRSAAALERLILCSSSPGCTRPGGCSKANCSFLYVPRMSCELHTNFLSGNEAEEWELKKRKYSYEYRFSNYACLRSEVDSEVASC